jgi:hypothetical protein
VEQVCQGIAEQGGSTFRDPEIGRTKKDCLNTEQEVRANLVKTWGIFGAAEKAHCVTETSMGGESSYTELLTCLEMARAVRQLHEEADRAQHLQAIGER